MIKRAALNEVALVRLGHHFRTSVKTDPTGNVRVLQMKDVSPDGDVRWDGLTQVVELKDKTFVKKGDIVFAHRGSRNYSALVDREVQNVLASGNLFVIRILDTGVMAEYLNWYLNQEPAQVFFEQHREGSYIPMLRGEWLKALNVPIPSLEIQKQVVGLNKIRKSEKALEKLLSEKKDLLVQSVVYKKIGLNTGRHNGKK